MSGDSTETSTYRRHLVLPSAPDAKHLPTPVREKAGRNVTTSKRFQSHEAAKSEAVEQLVKRLSSPRPGLPTVAERIITPALGGSYTVEVPSNQSLWRMLDERADIVLAPSAQASEELYRVVSESVVQLPNMHTVDAELTLAHLLAHADFRKHFVSRAEVAKLRDSLAEVAASSSSPTLDALAEAAKKLAEAQPAYPTTPTVSARPVVSFICPECDTVNQAEVDATEAACAECGIAVIIEGLAQ